MKKVLSIISLFLLTLLLAGCAAASQPADAPANSAAPPKDSRPAGKKILIVYFSHSGNTKEVARQIQQMTGGDIAEIKTAKPYPRSYNDTTKQAKQELEAGFKPELQPVPANIAQYDTVLIGSPLWWGTISMPVISFLSKNDMSAKTVVPFVTHGGSGLGRSVAHIKELCPKATVTDGLAIRSREVKNAQNDIAQWLKKLNLYKS